MNSEFFGKSVERARSFLQTRFGRLAAVILLSLLGIFVLFNYAVMPIYTRQGTERLVPNLTSIPVEQARVAADSAGFELVVTHGKVSTRVPEGHVLEQHPFAGTMAKPGRKIRAIPALAGVPDVAPDLVGLDVRDAQLRCRNIGLVSGPTEIRYRFSGRIPKDGVIEQDPPAGRPVKAGTVVKLIVSMGPEPAHFYVPQLVEESLHDARELLREAGLRLGQIERRESAEYQAGTVIDQSLRAGLEVSSGTEIHVVVATRPMSGEAPELVPEDFQSERARYRDSVRAERMREDSLRVEEIRKQDSIRRARRRY